MSVEVWPFLVSRNEVFDYRVVVAPQFMIENKAASLIAKVAGGEVTPPTLAMRREVHHPNPAVGNASFIFCIMEANRHHVGLEENEILKDQYGRSIRLIEGFVVRGQGVDIDNIMVTKDDLLEVFQTMQRDYQAFWLETEPGNTPAVKSSTPLDLPLDDSSRRSDPHKILQLKDIEPYRVKLKVTADLNYPESVASQTVDLPPLPPKTKKQWVDEGDQLAAKGHYEESRLHKQNIGSYEEALNAYKQAILLPSQAGRRDDAPAYRGKGDVFFYQKKYSDAERAYDEACECDSQYALAYNGKGLVSSQGGKNKEAIHFYEQAIKYDTNCALAYANKGFALKHRGDHDKAFKAFEDAVSAYDRLIHDEEKAFLYYYKIIALLELGSQRKDDVRIAKENASRLGFIINS